MSWSCGLKRSKKQRLKKTISELEERVKGQEETIETLQTQKDKDNRTIDELTSTKSDLEKRLKMQDEKIETLTSTKSDLEKRVKKQDETIETLHTQKDKDNRTIDELTSTKSDLETKVKKQDENIETLTSTYSGLYQELKEQEGTITTLKDEFEREKQHMRDDHGNKIQRKDEEIQSMQNEIQQKKNIIKQIQREKDEEKTAKEEERRQKDEALTRLSAIAGDRLRNNNPGITDLSDPNRPMKIAEKFTEMYDNDWTDAMEALEDLQIEEDQCVEILLHFLTDAYEECKDIVSELDNHLVKAVSMTVFENGCKEAEMSDQSKQNIPAELIKPIRDLRKTFTSKSIDELQKKIPHRLKEKRQLTDKHMKACENFLADCIRYAWMMQIQDPPVHIEWKFPKGSKIDTNILRSYTKAGDHVDFVVWPVLYLHKDGPVLNKGVVQPLQSKE